MPHKPCLNHCQPIGLSVETKTRVTVSAANESRDGIRVIKTGKSLLGTSRGLEQVIKQARGGVGGAVLSGEIQLWCCSTISYKNVTMTI